MKIYAPNEANKQVIKAAKGAEGQKEDIKKTDIEALGVISF